MKNSATPRRGSSSNTSPARTVRERHSTSSARTSRINSGAANEGGGDGVRGGVLVWSCCVRTKPELIAPAGNMECARAAVANGADAVYFGLPRFNARMRADNFTEEQLPEL